MIKTFKIDGHPVEFNSSSGWLYVHEEQFGYDILPVIMPVIEAGTQTLLSTIKGAKNAESDELMDVLRTVDEMTISEAFEKLSEMRTTTLMNIIWSMAKNADDDIPAPKEWLNSYEVFPLDEIVPFAFMLMMESLTSKKKYKKIVELIKGLKTEKEKKTENTSHSEESPSEQSTEDSPSTPSEK